jgi:hypothetical protein
MARGSSKYRRRVQPRAAYSRDISGARATYSRDISGARATYSRDISGARATYSRDISGGASNRVVSSNYSGV